MLKTHLFILTFSQTGGMLLWVFQKEITKKLNCYIMTNPKSRPMPFPARRPLTEEEQKQQVAQALVQARERYALAILANMVQGAITNKDATNIHCKELVDVAVEMADHLINRLFPVNQSTDKAND